MKNWKKSANALTQEVVTYSNIQRYLYQAEETARALLNATTDSAILIDTQGTILAIREKDIQILNYTGAGG